MLMGCGSLAKEFGGKMVGLMKKGWVSSFVEKGGMKCLRRLRDNIDTYCYSLSIGAYD